MRRVPIAALVLVAALLASATPANAHASLEAADPAPGSTLPASPEAVSLTFTEPPDPDLTTVEVLDVGGAAVAASEPRLDGPRTVRVDLEGILPDGSYTVSWRVVSTVDGHLTSGQVVFGVGVAPAPDTSATADDVAGPSAGSIAAKAALSTGLFVLLAAALIGLGVFGGRPRSLHVVAMVGAVLALVGALGLLVTEQRAVGVPMDELLASSTGRPLLWLVIAVLVADVLAVIAASRPSWRQVLWGAGAAAAAAMWVRASGGHAAAADPSLPHELAQWIHMMTAALWIGGLGLLWLLLRETRDTDPPLTEASRFSNVALGAVAAVVVTGVFRSLEELGPLGALLGSTYGRVLAAKVALALTLIALGAINRRRSVPRLAEGARPLRRIVGAELTIALGVILLSATLTGAAPDESSTAETPGTPAPVTAAGTDFATTISVRLTLAPGAPGPSTVEARVTDPDSDETIIADEVTLRVRSVTRPEVAAETVELAAQDGAWTATTPAFSLAGTYSATVVVRSGADATDVPLVLTTRLPGSEQTVDVGPGLPTVITTTFADGISLQTYVDPGTAGTNQIHATGFTPDGTEQALDDVVIVAIPEAGEPRRLDVTDLGPGHVAANVDLDAGGWTFDVVATADGGVLQATFDETIGAP